MISKLITVSGLNQIADMLENEEHCLLLTKNDFHNIATACLDELDDSQHRPLLRPSYRRIYQLAVQRMAEFST
jgi:hypothetical protein